MIRSVSSGNNVRICAKRKVRRLSATIVLGFALPLAIAMGGTVDAQTPLPAAPSFQTVSIHKTRVSADQYGGQMFVGRATFRAVPLERLIEIAYGLKIPPVDGPEWIGWTCFDIDAQASDAEMDALKQLPKGEAEQQTLLMLRTLLKDRFDLEVSNETREMPTYALVVGKHGVKMTAAPDVPGDPKLQGGWGKLQAEGATTGVLADYLSNRPEIGSRKVMDETGLKGKWNFTLTWAPVPGGTNRSLGAEGSAARAGNGYVGPEAFVRGLPLFAAIEDQLGLKLESSKGPVEVLVIHRVERLPGS